MNQVNQLLPGKTEFIGQGKVVSTERPDSQNPVPNVSGRYVYRCLFLGLGVGVNPNESLSKEGEGRFTFLTRYTFPFWGDLLLTTTEFTIRSFRILNHDLFP